jgi:hypothetical protein
VNLQTLVVALCVLAALAYLLRPLVQRWRARRQGLVKPVEGACSACSNCSGCAPRRP